MFFWGTPERVKFAVFSILSDPGCPGDPKVGPHTDCVASWDTVGGIQALGRPQGPLQTGFGGRTRWSRGSLGSFVRQIWLEKGENFVSWILPDPGCRGDPKVGSHSDCMVSWDTTGGLQALFVCRDPYKPVLESPQDGAAGVGAILLR